jgi:hypothetical protein
VKSGRQFSFKDEINVRKKTEGRSEVKYFVCAKIYHKLFQTLLLLLREAFAMFLVL